MLIIAISLATAVAISVTIAVVAKHWLKEDLRHHAAAVSQSLARSMLVHVTRDEVWEAFEAVRAIVSVEADVDVVVLDRNRRVFVSSDPVRFPAGADVTALAVPLGPVERPSPLGAVVADARSDGKWFTVASVPLVSEDGEAVGSLLMSFSQAPFAARYADTVSTVGWISLGIAAVLLPLGWWLGHRLAAQMTRATDSLHLTYVTALKEIEQHKLARDAAEHANKAKSEFLAHMSHELRSPLNAILGYAQILQRDSTLGERQLSAVRIIHQSGEHLLALIDERLDLARIEVAKPVIAPPLEEPAAAPIGPHAPPGNGADRPLVNPPANELEVLFHLAKVGNMRDIRKHAEHVATLGAQYRPFAEHLQRLADECQSRAILELVSQSRADAVRMLGPAGDGAA